MKRFSTACAAVAAVVLLANMPAFALRPVILSHAPANGHIFPDAPRITNPYSPLIPGTTFIYEGKLGRAPERDVMTVTQHTRVITGVPCADILDRVFISGRLEELTHDYYAQDYFGNVWYFGEYETTFHPHGHKSSWITGKNGASPGIVMEASPRVGDTYRQENAPPVAEDMARVLSLTQSLATPFGSFFGNVLETKEFSPLEPGVVDRKYYEPGIGLLEDDVVRGGPEILQLTGITVDRT